MIELYEAIYWKLVHNKDVVVSTPQIDSEKLSTYIGEGGTNRILPAYPDQGKPTYPCLIINCHQDIETDWPETARVLIQIYFYTTSDIAGGKQHTQLNSFFSLARHFLAEQWDLHNDLIEVKDDGGNLVIGGKYSVESFTLNWIGSVAYLDRSNEFQLPTRWLSYVTQEYGG